MKEISTYLSCYNIHYSSTVTERLKLGLTSKLLLNMMEGRQAPVKSGQKTPANETEYGKSPPKSASSSRGDSAQSRQSSGNPKSMWALVEERAGRYGRGQIIEPLNLNLNDAAVKSVVNWLEWGMIKRICDQYDQSTEHDKKKTKESLPKVLSPLLYVLLDLQGQAKPKPKAKGSTQTESTSLSEIPLDWNTIENKAKTMGKGNCISYPLKVTAAVLKDLGDLGDVLKLVCNQYKKGRDASRKKIKTELGNFVASVLHIHTTLKQSLENRPKEEINVSPHDCQKDVPLPQGSAESFTHQSEDKDSQAVSQEQTRDKTKDLHQDIDNETEQVPPDALPEIMFDLDKPLQENKGITKVQSQGMGDIGGAQYKNHDEFTTQQCQVYPEGNKNKPTMASPQKPEILKEVQRSTGQRFTTSKEIFMPQDSRSEAIFER